MMQIRVQQISLLLLTVFPGVVSAAPQNFQEVVGFITGFIGILVPVVIALTFIYVLWGIVHSWIIKGGSQEGVDSGKMVVVTGIIGLTVMVGIWGIVSLVKSAIFY